MLGYSSTNDVRQKFTQKERDVETGLDYFGARYYGSTQGRFTSADPLLSSGRPSNPRIANGQLGSIAKITEEELAVALDSGREVSFEADKFRHLDHGYAVTSYSSQSQTVDRVLINADANESDLLLNQRMGYVAISRAREEAMIFTNSADQLRAALDRRVDKEMAVEALRESKQHDSLSREERERSASPTNHHNTIEQLSPEMTNSSEDNHIDNSHAEEDIELELSS